ncbi:MAG: nitroreductase family protein, partial [Chloroflexota bacterium]
MLTSLKYLHGTVIMNLPSHEEFEAMPDLSTTSNLITAIQSRRSLRRYQQQAIPKASIEAVLDAGTWAPSAHNRQPWRFAVLQTTDSKDTLARAMGKRLQADLERDYVPQAVIEKEVTRSYDRLTSAPVVIVVNLTMRDMDTYSNDLRNTNEHIMAIQSVAMAGQNILLAA